MLNVSLIMCISGSAHVYIPEWVGAWSMVALHVIVYKDIPLPYCVINTPTSMLCLKC